MTRKEFFRICSILGVTAPCHAAFSSCGKDEPFETDFTGKVIIIGAGAGGLSAGYLLQQQGIDFQILEASAVYGGRMRINTDFADFPIPLGAEWLETGRGIFDDIVNDSSINVDIETVRDAPDRKFVNYSWFNFFEDYIVPSVSSRISYNTVVSSVDYSGDKVVVTTQDDQLEADRVIISVPLKILQDKDLTFIPALPEDKQDAIDETTIWEGFKAFIQFSEKFYGDEYLFDISPRTDGQKLYYDAAFGQNTTSNILGLFTVGKPALDYINRSDDELRDFLLGELDSIYDGQASPNYIKHLTQKWDNEPFIKAGYMSDHADWRSVRTLGQSVDDKIYFAGGAYTDGEDWVSVHTAAQSAQSAVKELLK